LVIGFALVFGFIYVYVYRLKFISWGFASVCPPQALRARVDLAYARAAHSALVQQVNFRPELRNISVYGGCNLALKRNRGHTSSYAIVDIVAGDGINGSFRDRHIATKFEHLACAALRVRTADQIANIEQTLSEPQIAQIEHPDFDVSRKVWSLRVVQYMGDASNTAACDKEKIHVARVSMVALPGSEIWNSELEVHYVSSLADIQTVKHGTGAELAAIVETEMNSISMPTWQSRVAHAAEEPDVFTTYAFALDEGPDNKLMRRRAISGLQSTPNVALHVNWCVFHRLHHSCERAYGVMDDHEWPGIKWDVKFFSGMKIIANTWRATGDPVKIHSAACAAFGDVVGNAHFLKLIGRCLRGRWCSGHAVAQTISQSRLFIGGVFQKAFPAPKGKPRAAAGDDDMASYSEMLGRWRKISLVLTSDPHYLASVTICSIGLGPLMHLYNWGMNMGRKVRDLQTTAERSQELYLGSTFLSELVTHKAAEIRCEMCKLLTDAGACNWEELWSFLPAASTSSARQLIVTLMIQQIVRPYS